ncbi:ORF15 [Agrotis segetum granulovirus]|uniref:Baculo_E56 n=2 Tax=Agrotis segetum granulosis virus TaxID=10464 RepID=Q6QXD4_GVAS|nr:Baculo_E56 [Agrotis segetum granulovirus]AAS82723.1 ORF15 [Agrotis segetum granulovirus]AHN92055.1 odv-e56 [Agrotis segetum granulovirus]AKN63290.1 Baculo_E56 [Agrotis segetum granulovirus]
MSFFRGLRRTNKTYPNVNSFISDHNNLIANVTPSGFNLGPPSGLTLGPNRVQPGYNINNTFVPNSDINRIMRTNNPTGMRTLFPNANNSQINGLSRLRAADNIPDAQIYGLQQRKNSVKNSHPDLATRDPTQIEAALNNNPRLSTYLKGLGTVALVGAGVYLIIQGGNLVASIVAALNRTGGSYYFRGNNGAESFNNIESCILRHRTCGVLLEDIQPYLCQFDPLDLANQDPILPPDQAREICVGYNREREQTVCRASDSNAHPDSPAYFDISDLDVNQTIQCLEPYDFADLVADLGLDGLLGENGLISNMSNSLNSISENFMTILFVIGGIVLLLFIGFMIFRVSMSKKSE